MASAVADRIGLLLHLAEVTYDRRASALLRMAVDCARSPQPSLPPVTATTAPRTLPGRLITLEGGDGAGKGTVLASLVDHLQADGRTLTISREPGGTALGEAIRHLLLHEHELALNSHTEMLLFAAARAQSAAEVYRPALERGEIVLLDRMVHSSMAYQGVGRGLGIPLVAGYSRYALNGIWPDLTILLELSAEESERRRRGRDGERADRLESEGERFRLLVEEGYRQAALFDADTVVTISADGSPDEVVEQALAVLRERI